MPDFVKVILCSVGAFVSLFLIAKLLGKKQIAELNFVDYAVGISLGSIASEWATDYESPWYHYVIAMAIFFLFDLGVMLLSRKTPLLKRMLHGFPLVIVEKGKIDYDNLVKAKLSVNDLLGMCRIKGYFSLGDIEYAIFETNGEMSIMPRNAKRATVLSDLREDADKPIEFPAHVIIDGRICGEILHRMNQDEAWLQKRLGTDGEGLKRVLLATYDSERDVFDVHYKDEVSEPSVVK